MMKMGLPAHKAGAIEVAASTNGQLMPPIMGASAFIIAEFIGIFVLRCDRPCSDPGVHQLLRVVLHFTS